MDGGGGRRMGGWGGGVVKKVHEYSIEHKVHIKSTTVYVPSLELGLSPAIVPLPPEPKGGHSRLWVRDWGSPYSDDRRKSSALYFSVV